MPIPLNLESTPQGRKGCKVDGYTLQWWWGPLTWCYCSAVSIRCFDLAQWQSRKPGRRTLSDIRSFCGKLHSSKIRNSGACADTFSCDSWTPSTSHHTEMEQCGEIKGWYGHCEGESRGRSRVCWLLTATQPRNVTLIGRRSAPLRQVPKSSYESLHIPTNILQAIRHREKLSSPPTYILNLHWHSSLMKTWPIRSTVGRRLEASESTSELVISNSRRLLSSTASLLNLVTGYSTHCCSRSSRTLSKLSVATCASFRTQHRVHSRWRLLQWTEAALRLAIMAPGICNVPHRRTQVWYADLILAQQVTRHFARPRWSGWVARTISTQLKGRAFFIPVVPNRRSRHIVAIRL